MSPMGQTTSDGNHPISLQTVEQAGSGTRPVEVAADSVVVHNSLAALTTMRIA
jgi:hypothetical protein